MTTNRGRILLAGLAVLAAAALVLFLLRGSRDNPGVPDTTSMVGVVTPDPGPRPLPADGSDLLEAPPIGGSALPPAHPEADLPRLDAALTGTVQESSGRALTGASVWLREIDPQSALGAPYEDGPVLGRTESERDGRFRLEAPAGRLLRVFASHPGYATVAARVASAGVELTLTLPRAGSLEVTVLDEAGKPLSDAEVHIQSGDTKFRAAVSERGAATFDQLPPGTADVRVTAPGRGRVRGNPVRIVAGARASQTVTVPPGIRVAGQVFVRGQRTPIAGARVRLARPGASTDAGTTDAQGRFPAAFAGSQGARIFVYAEAPGYAPELVPVVLGAEPDTVQHVEVELGSAEPWRGEVVFPRGTKRIPATVYYTSAGVADAPPATTTTDENGRFELPPPPPPAPGRRVVLVAEAAGWRAAIGLRPHQAMPRPLVLVMVGGQVVSGRILDAQGKPVPGAAIRLQPHWEEGDARGELTPGQSLLRAANAVGLRGLASATDARGSFRLVGVPDATYDLTVTIEGARYTPDVEIDTRGGGVALGDVTIGTGFRVEGRVQSRSGEPLAGATVRLSRTEGRTRLLRTTTDELGQYVIPDVPKGRWWMEARLAGLSGERQEVDVQGDGLFDLTLEDGGRLEGMLLAGGAPYTGSFQLQLARPRGARSVAPYTLRAQRGRFAVADLPTGVAFSLTIKAPGGRYAFHPDAITFEPGGTHEVRLDLDMAVRFSGQVVTSSGSGVPGAQIQFLHKASGEVRLFTAGGAGRFEALGLRPGTWTVRVSGRGGAPTDLEVDLAAGEIREQQILLPGGGSVRVLVEDESGQPVEGALLLFRDDARAYPSKPPDRTGPDGIALRQDLPLGTIYVRARQGARAGTGRVDVVAGHTVEVTVALRAAR
jgi:protocatechuate 3,4-dioxygenase beta subunit